MEYFKYGDLQSHMNTPIPEVQSKIITAQLLQGLKLMHQEKFTHRDLKPQNIFVVETQPYFWVKIGDFGITKRTTNDQTFLKTEIGTLDYLAPEVLGYVDEETSQYTNSVDIWSLGCVCHRLLTMSPPFPKRSALATYCWGASLLPIEPNNYTTADESTVGVHGIEFVKALMRPQPNERPSADEALCHPWLKDVDALEADLIASAAERSSEPSEKISQQRQEEPRYSTSKSSQSDLSTGGMASTLVDRGPPIASENGDIPARGVSKQTRISGGLESSFGNMSQQQANLAVSSIIEATKVGQENHEGLLANAGTQQTPSIVAQSPKPHLANTSIALNESTMPLTAGLNKPQYSRTIGRRTPPLLSLQSRKVEIVRDFRRAGFNIEEVVAQGPELRMTDAFEWAANQADKIYIECLLDMGAQIRDPNRSLRWASASGIISAVQRFLKRGADVNSTGSRGFTALHTACRCRHTDVVRLLLESGADVHARTNEGMTALQFTPTDDQRRRGPITSLLLEYGASPKGSQSAMPFGLPEQKDANPGSTDSRNVRSSPTALMRQGPPSRGFAAWINGFKLGSS